MTRTPLNSAQREKAAYQLRHNALFSPLSNADFSDLLTTASIARLREGQTLFKQHEKAIAFFLLQTGQVKLMRLSSAGNEKIIELISPGQSFAEAVMFSNSVYPVSAVALCESHIWCIDTETYIAILKRSHEASFAVMAELSRRLHQQLGEIDYLTLHNATARLIAYLLDQASTDVNGEIFVALSHTKVVLASRLSITPETLSRTFAKLSKDNLIRIEERRISLLDITKLKQMQMSE